MAEINVVKPQKPQRRELRPWFGVDAPMFRGNRLNLNPVVLMKHLVGELDRVLEQAPQEAGKTAWAPDIEVREKDGTLLVVAELPGVDKGDISVQVEGDTLIVKGEKKAEEEEKREGYFHSERTYGTFYRSVLLPEGAKVDETAAHFNNGVLEVTVPIAVVKTPPKDIPVQAGIKAA